MDSLVGNFKNQKQETKKSILIVAAVFSLYIQYKNRCSLDTSLLETLGLS